MVGLRMLNAIKIACHQTIQMLNICSYEKLLLLLLLLLYADVCVFFLCVSESALIEWIY